MLSRYLLFTLSILIASNLSAQQNGYFKDARDGKVYKTVKIGEQVWMAENLNAERFRNGDTILEAKSGEEWRNAAKNQQPAWCYYDNDTNNGKKYGKLYNWYAISDKRGLAPLGWHIPEREEMIPPKVLADNYFTALKSDSGWISNDYNGNGTNLSGFDAKPGGARGIFGFGNAGFFLKDRVGMWWSSKGQNKESDNAEMLVFIEYVSSSYKDYGVSFYTYKSDGLSVRCIKD